MHFRMGCYGILWCNNKKVFSFVSPFLFIQLTGDIRSSRAQVGHIMNHRCDSFSKNLFPAKTLKSTEMAVVINVLSTLHRGGTYSERNTITGTHTLRIN